MPRPQITMPNSGGGARSPLYGDYDDDTHQRSEPSKRVSASEGGGAGGGGAAGGKPAGGGGWFGGIFNKLSLKPKNQMILPDDKNPTIVWDAEKKRWKNLDGEEEESTAALPPPPRAAPVAAAPGLNASAASAGVAPSVASFPATAAAASASNIFKMQKGRHIKKSYVDVFNPSGAASRAPPAPPPADLLPPPPAATLPAAGFFVPSMPQGGAYEPSQFDGSEPHYQ